MAEAEGDDAGEGHQGGQSQQRHGEALGLILDEAEQLRAGIAAKLPSELMRAMPPAAEAPLRKAVGSVQNTTRLRRCANYGFGLQEFAKRVNRRSMHAE